MKTNGAFPFLSLSVEKKHMCVADATKMKNGLLNFPTDPLR